MVRRVSRVDRLEPEFDQRLRLIRDIDIGFDVEGVPGEGEQALMVHALDPCLPGEPLILRKGQTSRDQLADHERPVQLHTKPGAEFLVIGEGPPHP